MIERLLKYIVYICKYTNRHRTITNRKGNGPYLERYYVFLKKRKRFPINFVIHEFKESDEDDLHDHPWWFFTFIIKGQYYEHTPKGCFLRKPFQFRFSKATDLHRVELINEESVWTFFMMGPRVREWGFIHNNKWFEWKKYVENMRKNTLQKDKKNIS